MFALFIIGCCAAYLTVGVLSAAALVRIGYSKDPAKIYERGYEHYQRKEIEKKRNIWLSWGIATVFFWPIELVAGAVLAVIFGLCWVVWKGLEFAIMPPQLKALMKKYGV